MPIIKSKRFILRPFKKGDEKPLQKNINNRAVYRYTQRIPYPYTMKAAKEWISSDLKSQRNKNRDAYRFAVDINKEVVGVVALENIQKHKAEIGYWLAKKYWNKEIMTEAVELITKFGFEKLKLARIYAPIFSRNGRSARVLEKNGFILEGMLRKDIYKDGRFSDAKLYAKIK